MRANAVGTTMVPSLEGPGRPWVTMRRIISASCGVFCILLVVGVGAQGPAVRRDTTEVLVDMVARDKHSRIVRDLKPEEIQILEDGVPQTIRHFEFFVGHDAGDNGDVASAPPAAPISKMRTLREATVVSFVVGSLNPEGRKSAREAVQEFVKNDLHPNTFVGVFVLGYVGVQPVQTYTNDGKLILAAMERVVGTEGQRIINEPDLLPDNLEAADTAPLGPTSTAHLERNSNLEGKQVTASVPGPAADIAAEADLMQTYWIDQSLDAYDSSMRELLGIKHFAQAQARIPGRKLLFLFAGGLIVHPETVQVLNSAISVANRSQVTIYSVDTIRDTGQNLEAGRHLLAEAAASSRATQETGGRVVVLGDQVAMFDNAERSTRLDERGNMRELAESTGGAMLPMQDLREPFRRAMEDAGTHYEFTYTPAKPDFDGRFRKIEVRVTRPGVKVFARRGYYALPTVNGEEIYPFEMAALQAMNATPEPKQLDFQSNVLRFRTGSQRSQFSFACEIPVRGLSFAEDKEWARVHVSITALVKDAQGQVVDKLSKDIPYSVPEAKAAELRRGVVSFTTPFRLPPGNYSLEIAAVDDNSGHAGIRHSEFSVPPASGGLAVSDFVVARRVDPAQGPQDKGDPLLVRGGKVTPELSGVIDRDAPGDLFFYAAAYLAPPVQDPVRATLEILRDGQALVRTPESNVPLEGNSTAPFVASFPRAKLQPGQYNAVLTFRYRDQTARTEAAFAVKDGDAAANPPH
jgi:VWFA-related protein